VLKTLSKIATLSVFTLIGVVGLLFYRHTSSTAARIADLENKNSEMKEIIGRLEYERRIADFVVSDQRIIDGKRHTSLLMVEYDKAGAPLPPRSFEVIGNRVHVDAYVVKFDQESVRKGDSLRGKALLLFEKIYGDAQAPADGSRIDPPTQSPEIYRDVNPRLSAFEQKLWTDFWRLVTDEPYRKEFGVSVAYGSGVFFPAEKGRRYTLTLAANGNVTAYNEPLPEIFSRLMKQSEGR
jgi:hypothetical protein